MIEPENAFGSLLGIQMGPIPMRPEQIYGVSADYAFALSDVICGPPQIIGSMCAESVELWCALHHERPVAMCFEPSQITPGLVRKIAGRDWLEEQFGHAWWSFPAFVGVKQALSDIVSNAPMSARTLLAARASFPVDLVRSKYLAPIGGSYSKILHQCENLQPIGFQELIESDYPEPDYLLSPWLKKPGIALLFAERGVGKSLFSSAVAYAVATGTPFLCWESGQKRPSRVLYIDGEMPIVEIQKRFRRLCQNSLFTPEAHALAFLAADSHPSGLPDLSTAEGQDDFAPYLSNFDLIIVDNLSTLCRTGVENEAESWAIMQQWAIQQRSAGRSVLFIHHAGKSGAQRGTSRREDIMDTVVQLKRVSGYEASDGARFELNFTKARHFFGAEAEPLEVHLRPDGTWSWSGLKDATAAEIVERYSGGDTQRDIAADLGISQSTVSKALAAAGIICRKGRRKTHKGE